MVVQNEYFSGPKHFFSTKEDFMNTFNLAQCMMVRLSMYTYCISKSAFDFVMAHFFKGKYSEA